MWKPNADEKPVSVNPPAQPTLTPPAAPVSSKENRFAGFRADVAAHIGKSVVVKGELSGSEDLYVDGEVEGTIALQNNTLVVGPNSRIRANISAREVIVHGKVDGNITGAERVELKSSSVVSGDVSTPRIVIEDGAFLKGSVDSQSASKAEPAKMVAVGGGSW